MDSYTLSNIDDIVHIQMVDREPSDRWSYTPTRTTSFFGYFKREIPEYIWDKHSFEGASCSIEDFEKDYDGYVIDRSKGIVYINYKVKVTFVNNREPKVYYFKTEALAEAFKANILSHSSGDFQNLNKF